MKTSRKELYQERNRLYVQNCTIYKNPQKRTPATTNSQYNRISTGKINQVLGSTLTTTGKIITILCEKQPTLTIHHKKGQTKSRRHTCKLWRQVTIYKYSHTRHNIFTTQEIQCFKIHKITNNINRSIYKQVEGLPTRRKPIFCRSRRKSVNSNGEETDKMYMSSNLTTRKKRSNNDTKNTL